MKFKDKKVLVFGSGISGVSAAALLLQEGAEVVLYDGNDRLDAAGIKEQIEGQAKGSVSVVLGAFPEALLSELSLVVMSPGVPTDLPSVNQMRDAGIPIWGASRELTKISKISFEDGVMKTGEKTLLSV